VSTGARPRRPGTRRLYRAYIGSPAWTDRKERYWATYDRSCTVCGTKERVGLHHLEYRHLGDEPDEDLLPLCWSHHEGLHVYADQQVDVTLRQSSAAYVEAMGGPNIDPGTPKQVGPRDAWLVAIQSPCRKCGAQPGEPCWVVTGQRRRAISAFVHLGRHRPVDWHTVTEVPCSQCGAESGKDCMEGNKALIGTHNVRRQAWLDA